MIVGLIPAAGEARRLQPLTGSKEAIAIGGRPVIAYVIDRMRSAGPSVLVVVTRPEKEDVASICRAEGAVVALARTATVSETLLVGLELIPDGALVMIGLPDTIWDPPDGFPLLLARLSPDVDGVLGLFTSDEPTRGDVVQMREDGVVTEVAVKPRRPRGDLVWGCAVLRRSALGALRDHDEPGHLFDAMARQGRMAAVRLSGGFLDIGTHEALASALADPPSAARV